MPEALEKVWVGSLGATRSSAWNYTLDLDAGETLTGTPTIVEVGTTDLTITNKAVSVASLVIDERTVAIGKAVQCKISGFKAGATYTVRVTVATSAGDALVYDQLIMGV